MFLGAVIYIVKLACCMNAANMINPENELNYITKWEATFGLPGRYKEGWFIYLDILMDVSNFPGLDYNL